MLKRIIGIDAMGGSNAPRSVLKAVSEFLLEVDDVAVYLYGKKSQLLQEIVEYKFDSSRYKIIDCKGVVSDDLSPQEAWKLCKNSSMRKMLDDAKRMIIHATVSCGNTGAMMLMSKMILGMLPNVKRPAITAIFPNLIHKKNNAGTVLLDMGANLECDANNLLSFALMGSCFAKIILKKENPTIGILNVGSEKNKGRKLEQQTFELLQQSRLNFIGFVEGNEVIANKTDVLITDGFSGNIFLKASEGTAYAFMSVLKSAIAEANLLQKFAAAILKPALKDSMRAIDPDKNNGAMFIGLNGVVVKSHGSANSCGIKNAIYVAYRLAKHDINKKICLELERLENIGDISALSHGAKKIFEKN